MSAIHHYPYQLVAIKTGTYSPETWEAHRMEISELYASNTLNFVMETMQQRHGFKATPKQWKSRLEKWGLDTKNIKKAEYLAIVRKKRQREQESPGKETQFILNGSVVSEEKIQRFELQQRKKARTAVEYDDAPTPPTLVSRTPPPAHDENIASDDGIDADVEEVDRCFDSLEYGTALAQPSPATPRFFSNALKSFQPSPSLRIPSPEDCEWFELFIDYSKCARSKPLSSQNPRHAFMLDTGEPLASYQEEFALRAFLRRHKMERLNVQLVPYFFYCMSVDPETRVRGFELRD